MARTGRSSTGHRLQRGQLTLDEVLRAEGGQVLATLVRLTGDFDLAEDAWHDAVVAATEQWKAGAPAKPGAWLTTVARNKALDRLRREAQRTPKEREAFRLLTHDDEARPPADDTGPDLLRLIFTCCHPALSPVAQRALTLRTLCGLTVPEIARVFLVNESTIGQRISRAKAKIAGAHIPYRVPDAHELPDRLPAVLSTLYAVFTVGHHAPSGETVSRFNLADEAIRLARTLVTLMPDEGEAVGLLALMLATNGRRQARFGRDGELVLLADQDRSLWDHSAIDEADELIETILGRGRAGAYQLQAAIACLHGLAPTSAETDWAQIAELYRMLEGVWPTSVVRVNRAVAVAEVDGCETGLQLLDACAAAEPEVERWHLYWATRADFNRRLGALSHAADAYLRALGCPGNETDRRFLTRRLADVRADVGPSVRAHVRADVDGADR